MKLLQPRTAARTCLRAAAVAIWLTFMLSAAGPVSPARAHSDLIQSSPLAGETVGGAIHSVALQFIDLDVNQPQNARIFDAAGTEVTTQLNREDQRIVLSLPDPIATSGDYTVIYAVTGIDGDFTQESFTFTWQEGAPEPQGITIAFGETAGFDLLNFILLTVVGALAAFLVAQVMYAWREHKAAQRVAK